MTTLSIDLQRSLVYLQGHTKISHKPTIALESYLDRYVDVPIPTPPLARIAKVVPRPEICAIILASGITPSPIPYVSHLARQCLLLGPQLLVGKITLQSLAEDQLPSLDCPYISSKSPNTTHLQLPTGKTGRISIRERKFFTGQSISIWHLSRVELRLGGGICCKVARPMLRSK